MSSPVCLSTLTIIADLRDGDFEEWDGIEAIQQSPSLNKSPNLHITIYSLNGRGDHGRSWSNPSIITMCHRMGITEAGF